MENSVNHISTIFPKGDYVMMRFHGLHHVSVVLCMRYVMKNVRCYHSYTMGKSML